MLDGACGSSLDLRQEVVANFPRYQATKEIIKKGKRKVVPPQPTDRKDLILELEWELTSNENDMESEVSCFLIDFESAFVSALSITFPRVTVRGCFFHFGQAVWRKVQNLGLTSFYDNQDVKKLVHRLAALPLADPNIYEELWEEINHSAPNITGIADLLLYFYNTWLSPNALFPYSIWNHFENDGLRTTNHVEGWHNAFHNEMNRRISQHI
ncbi:uncharacterized protein LOC136084541 isoform X1 [Hydra vulgaris]|uniref:Uncharacterized protein LOC136084541 isoform X1 n=1 Tax=Hydra vulgaris TaxID=6087 RepID=A0ABM4CG94_HYDVU